MRVHIVLAAALLALQLLGAARGADLPRELTSQAAPALEQARKLYHRATIYGVVRREEPPAHKASEQEFVLRASGARLRLDLTTLADQGMGTRVGATNMYMATGIGSLVTMRAPGETVFHDARELKYADTKHKIESTVRLNDVYTFGDYPTVLDFLRQPGVSGVRFKTLDRDGQKLLKVNYQEITGRQDKQTAWSSYFIFSPAEQWAIREYSRTTGSGDTEVTYRGKLTYSGTLDGAPIVEQIQRTEERGKQHQVVVRETISVTRFLPGEPPNDFFTAFDF